MTGVRYSKEFLEEVRARNPIQDVIGQHMKLTKRGKSIVGVCPFHGEGGGAFSVSPSKQIFHCFGCGAGGDVISFVMKHENTSFPEAIKKLAERAGMPLPVNGEAPAKDENGPERLYDVCRDAELFYRKALYDPAGSAGLQYLKERGLSDETIREFGLGFAEGKGDALYQYLKNKGYSKELLSDSGLVTFSGDRARDMFRNRVMFPIRDAMGRVTAFGGRVMGEGEPKYLNSRESPVFEKGGTLFGLNAAGKTGTRQLIVCEGYLDVITLHRAGYTNAVAPLGTAFTSRHAAILGQFAESVLLCFDSDTAGSGGILRAIPLLRREGLRTKVISLVPFKDPDELIRQAGSEEFAKRIRSAVNAFVFEVRAVQERFDLTDPGDKAAFLLKVVDMRSEFKDEMERNAHTEVVSKLYGIDAGMLKRKVGQVYSAARKREEQSELRADRKP